MRYFIFIMILAVSGCASSDIVINRDAMKSLKSVTVAPFVSRIKVKKEILSEAEGIFRTAFTKMDYKVAGKDKADELKKVKDADLSGFSAENAKRIGKLTGADAVLFGEIIKYEEETKERMFYPGFIGTNKLSNKSGDELRYITTYKFQIIVKLVNTSDGSVLMTASNRYNEIQQEENLQCCNTLENFSKYSVNKTAEELVETMK
jgi:curli biogenesis system outer membrane secretion channel CsgG